MQNPRLANRYAKSLLDLAQELNSTEAVLADMKLVQEVCGSSHDFVLMLRSPVIKADKKISIIKAVLEGKIQPLTFSFIDLLTKKGREFFLEEMAGSYIQQYKESRNIKTVNLTTAVAIDEQVKKMIHDKVAASVTEGKIELQTNIDASLIGGFTLEVGDRLFDASVKRDLTDIRKQFTKNLYIADI